VRGRGEIGENNMGRRVYGCGCAMGTLENEDVMQIVSCREGEYAGCSMGMLEEEDVMCNISCREGEYAPQTAT
jgi:hypothetical protein